GNTELFFFQAEDGIRDFHVTGVQTCALPISAGADASSAAGRAGQGGMADPGGCPVSRRVQYGYVADDWRHHAACRDEDPELFFPIGTSGPALLQVEQAKAVCRRCTAAEQCLAEALRRREYGIWGEIGRAHV